MLSNNGVIFNGETPIMDGTWYNPQTGDSFTVRDTMFENNQLVVVTTDNRVLNYNQLQNYIKSDKPINTSSPSTTPSTRVESIPHEVLDLIDGPYQESVPDNKEVNRSKECQDRGVVNKVLSKLSNKGEYMPKVDVSTKWEDVPVKEIDMLINLLDIPVESIVEWYVSKLSLETLHDKISSTIKNKLKSEISPVVDTEKNKTGDKPTKTKKIVKKNE